MERTSLEELLEKSKSLEDGELLLDVRTQEEFDEGHVKGAKLIPHMEVGHHVEELKNYKKVYVYCRRGRRAQMACEVLEAEGLDNLFCVGDEGTEHWVQKGYPLEK